MWSTRVSSGKGTHKGGGDHHLSQEVGRENQKGKGRKKINILLTIDSLIHTLDSFLFDLMRKILSVDVLIIHNYMVINLIKNILYS